MIFAKTSAGKSRSSILGSNGGLGSGRVGVLWMWKGGKREVATIETSFTVSAGLDVSF